MLFLPKWRWQANATRDHAAAEFPFETDTRTQRNSGVQVGGDWSTRYSILNSDWSILNTDI